MSARSSMTNSEILALACRQLVDYDALEPGRAFAEPTFCLDLGDAYRVQIEIARLRAARGERVAGYKIGCVSAAVRQQLGTEHAVFGHLFSDEVRTSPVKLRASEFCHLGIEGEMALMLDDDIDDPGRLRQDPARFVRETFPVIELHHYVFRGQRPSAVEVVANNALQAGIVVPPIRTEAGATKPVDIKVKISDRVDATATVDPSETLYELATRLAAFGIRPRAGDILLTGSPLPLYPVTQGESIRVECRDIASVTATVL